MKLYIDTEFNGYKGELISLALVAEDGSEFYEVLSHKNPTEWVRDNIIPVLNKKRVTLLQFRRKLKRFLDQYKNIEIVADWFDDIKYFNEIVIDGPGTTLVSQKEMKFSVIRVDAPSKVRHNALEDARGLRDFLMN